MPLGVDVDLRSSKFENQSIEKRSVTVLQLLSAAIDTQQDSY
ncbi:hypothetical protein Cha6605_0698 [Chamaesiphon minutus PCC 6605]|uniref:Uncharacterized protein n=1 Tax=Chamaesiphon minutus (strain ATCC 27169 / PCC 6605) TaxID=1173020 RepID=K9UAV2_CHAP6|nr:hypothetical protein Cha6605_0698 [Chamaesiphon minutus PCC 6605]